MKEQIFILLFFAEHVTTSEDLIPTSAPSTSVRVVIPGLASLSQDLSQTFNISDAANNKSLKLARDMELYEKRSNNYRATILLAAQKEAEAKREEDEAKRQAAAEAKRKRSEDGENNEEEEEEEEAAAEIVLESLDPLDFWTKVSSLIFIFKLLHIIIS